METFTPDQFPLLSAYAAKKSVRTADTLRKDLELIASATIHGGLRKVIYEDVKHTLSRLVDEAWKAHVSEPFFYGKGDIQDKQLQELYWSISVMSLHDMLSTKKKIDKSKVTGKEIVAMRAFADEIHPLAVAMAALKSTVVKGRAAPDPERAAAMANPDKIVKTCPCCFRQIAIQGELMAHHGYERPGGGFQTSSCIGTRFKPLEVSREGLDYIFDAETRRLAGLKVARKEAPKRTEISELNWRTKKLLTVTPVDGAKWTQAMDRLISGLDSDIRICKSIVKDLTAAVEKWVKTEPDGLCSVRKPSKTNNQAHA